MDSKSAPGPRGYPLVGMLPHMKRDVVQFFIQIAREYGDVVAFKMGPRLAFLCTAPHHVQHILQDNHRNYTKGPLIRRVMPLLGNGLTTSEGELWRAQRRLLQPAFHRQRLADFGPLMTTTIGEVLDTWARFLDGRPFDIVQEARHLTLNVLLRTLFGTDMRAEELQVSRSFEAVVKHICARGFSALPLPLWLPTPKNRQFRRSLQLLDAAVYRLIEARRPGSGDRGDVLSMLVKAYGDGAKTDNSAQQLRDEVITILFAGHETTSLALGWTWYLLAQHPAVASRLREEVSQQLQNRLPTIDDLPRLSYTRMVFQESMRLYPPAWGTTRMAVADDEIDGYAVPAGSIVWLCTVITHRRPDVWDHPDDFDPERFSPPRSEGRSRWSYFPFGGGPRRCIGESFAIMEAQLALAMVTQRYRLCLVPEHPVVPQPQLTFTPRHGILMTLKRHT
jgi:cytochrome P450